jgi:hypothetical protein
MKLAALLSAVKESNGPVTGIDLALRLGISPGQVAAMLDALRAGGQLGSEPEPDVETCSSAGSCTLACPGPGKCPLVIDLSLNSRYERVSGPSPK